MKKHATKTVTTLIVAMFIAAAATGLLNRQCIAADADGLTKGLVLHLSFDVIKDIAGQKLFMDESGNENNGILLAGKIVEGKIGNAFQCSAINKADGIRIKDNDSLDLDAVTIAAWIKTDQIDGQWNRILDKGWTESYNLCIGGDYKGESWFRNHGHLECAGNPITSKTPVVDGQWHFLVGTYDGQTSKIYIDGKLDVEKKWEKATPMKHNDVDITIGCLAVPEPNPYDHAFFDGLIDEVRLYNRVLSDEEVQTLYQYRPVD
jgi:hypothetical protein